MDRGAQQATVHGVAESWIQLSDLACMHDAPKYFHSLYNYTPCGDLGGELWLVLPAF